MGVAELEPSDICHRIMVIKINKLYQRRMPEKELYDAVRGIWTASIHHAKSVDYVFGVYNALIVAVYKPMEGAARKQKIGCCDRRFLAPRTENRLLFVDRDFEDGKPMDDAEMFYRYKSIEGLKANQSAQKPIMYLEPVE